jgi:NADH:ubiquinone oxidoreductase subunit 6 (subunit J)
MLNVKISEVQDEVLQYLPIGGLIGIVFLLEIFLIIEGDFISLLDNNNIISPEYVNWFTNKDSVSNIQTLGDILYTDYVLFFLLAGVILLIAMVGAIVLTMSTRTSLRRQFIYQQVSRDFDNAVFLVTHK